MLPAPAGESARILARLKRLMKSRGITYAALAGRIGLSEASVKRIFSRATLTLARLEQICRALEISIQELARATDEPANDQTELLTLAQESALAADAKLLACFYLIANGRSGHEIAAELGVDERLVRRWMVRLQALRLIELRPKLRARTRTASAIAWRRDGPVARLYERQVRQEFLQSGFSGSNELLQFRSAELSEASRRVFLRKLERLATEFRDLAELDRTLPAADKRSMAVLLAARPWVFSMFESLRHAASVASRVPR